ncbi:unnamed protein product [Cercospora beticola]|nr:unnamed protein product [Cercospora beticola]
MWKELAFGSCTHHAKLSFCGLWSAKVVYALRMSRVGGALTCQAMMEARTFRMNAHDRNPASVEGFAMTAEKGCVLKTYESHDLCHHRFQRHCSLVVLRYCRDGSMLFGPANVDVQWYTMCLTAKGL